MNDPRRVEAALAHNLREWRARRGWSLAELAARAGVSKGMLVQIEQSQTNPSIATLCKLANALGVALPRLVEVADEPVIRRVTRAEVAWLWRGRGKGSAAGLVGGIEAPIPVELWEWRMGRQDAYDALAHPPGTREVVYALEGQVLITVEGVKTTIDAGECAVFQADRPHRYAAAGGRTARFMMVVVEPLVEPAKAEGGRKRQKAEGKRQKAKGRRQKAKG
jgi:DNA-binding XRE family transcriptional regulator